MCTKPHRRCPYGSLFLHCPLPHMLRAQLAFLWLLFLFQLLTSDSLGFLAFLPISSPPSLKPGFPLLRAVADILWPSKGLWGGLPPAPPLPTFPISSTALVCEEPRVPRSLYPNSPLPFQGSPCGWPSPWNMTQKGEQDAHMRGGTGPSKVWGLAESQWWV